jgi:hypothetical protein
MQPTSIVQRCRVESQIIEKIKRLLHTTPGLTTKQIADRIGASDSHTAQALRRLRLHLGEVRIEGWPSRYYPSDDRDWTSVWLATVTRLKNDARRRRAARMASAAKRLAKFTANGEPQQ